MVEKSSYQNYYKIIALPKKVSMCKIFALVEHSNSVGCKNWQQNLGKYNILDKNVKIQQYAFIFLTLCSYSEVMHHSFGEIQNDLWSLVLCAEVRRHFYPTPSKSIY